MYRFTYKILFCETSEVIRIKVFFFKIIIAQYFHDPSVTFLGRSRYVDKSLFSPNIPFFFLRGFSNAGDAVKAVPSDRGFENQWCHRNNTCEVEPTKHNIGGWWDLNATPWLRNGAETHLPSWISVHRVASGPFQGYRI